MKLKSDHWIIPLLETILRKSCKCSQFISLISCTSQLERWVWKGDVLQWTETAAAWLRLPELFPRRTRTPKVTSPNSQAYHHRLPILTILNNWTMSQPFFWQKTNISNICKNLAPVFLTFRMYGMNLPKNSQQMEKRCAYFKWQVIGLRLTGWSAKRGMGGCDREQGWFEQMLPKFYNLDLD